MGSLSHDCDRIKKFESCRLTAYQDAAGDMDGAAREFDRWIYAGGKVLNGLVKRRAAEKAMFLNY